MILPAVLKQNAIKMIALMDGYDLRSALAQQIDLRTMIQAKFRALNLEAEPFLSARDCS